MDLNSIRKWREEQERLKELKNEKSGGGKKIGGGIKIGRKRELEESLLEWIFERRSNGFRVSKKIITLKAKKLQEDMEKEDPTITKLTFSAGWLAKFMKRNGLTIRRRITDTQKSPDHISYKLCGYVLKARRVHQKMNYVLKNIFAMDETIVCNDMISNTTVMKRGAHAVKLKTTGLEKNKVTVCLTTTVDCG